MSFRNCYEPTTYGRNRDSGRTNSTTDRPTTVTAKYTSPTSSYKTSSIPVLCNDRSAREETPISTVASRYASYNKADKINKYDKKDVNKHLVPSTTITKTRDVSPVSLTAKYGLSRTSRHISPDRRTAKSLKEKKSEAISTDRDKDIPSKTDKSAGYSSSLSSFKLYPRSSSYTRPATRTETKPEVTVNRYAIASRLSTSYLKSPTLVKRTSVSPVNVKDSDKTESTQHIKIADGKETTQKNKEKDVEENDPESENNNEVETINVVTRHTSPTPPGSSAYVRSRRADLAKTIEKTISRLKKRPEMVHKEIQSDRLDDPTRLSRFGSTSRTSLTNWSYYSPKSHNYTGYAGRYSTQYSNLRENSALNNYDKNNRISTEPLSKENSNISIHIDRHIESDRIDKTDDITTNSSKITETTNPQPESNHSDIVVNVNLKLKKVQDHIPPAELCCSEITLTNSNLPPQAPKADGPQKIKKNKVRKSSTDSSSDSNTKKKLVKKRSKSASSTDSEQSNDTNKNKGLRLSSSSKILNTTASSTNLQNGPLKSAQSKCRESNSPESSVTLSTQSSVSEEESNHKQNCNEFRTSTCEEHLIKQTSPVRTIKNEGGTEEAKSFLIRALAPVTNLFKLKHQDSFENSRRLENPTADLSSNDRTSFTSENSITSKSKNNSDNIIASNDDGVVKLKSIRPIESQDKTWRLDSDDVKASKYQRETVRQIDPGKDLKSEKQTCQLNLTESVESMKPLKKYLLCDDEKPWWLDSSANIPEGIERLTPPRKSSSDSDKSEKGLKIKSNDSDERKDWRIPNSGSCSHLNLADNQNSLSRSNSDIRNFPLRRIRHVESGERPWWLCSDKNIPEGIEKLPPPAPEHESDSSDSEDGHLYMATDLPPFPLHLPDDEPLGVRKSPEGLETPEGNEMYRGRISPYENYHYFRRNSNQAAYQKCSEKFICRFTDIDDILGTSGQIYSPFMDSILARRTGHMAFEDDDCEEIDPTQVRIHDSTAQLPVIKKLPCRSDILDYRDEDQLDDVTLQVFKDGDYGAYLDLDSTLGEQDEELEGLQDNRKNSLVLRTQLSVRVHGIIDTLLRSQGRELRRALFTLKQILQSDKDLVHEFVANKGLDCLMQVANKADHNYLDYILRALGQILLYVDGMHGVMIHKRCIQWLYSLIESKYRHVVKISLKLLLVFVEYVDKNCLLLIDAINVVDGTNGRQPWYNVMKILQDIDASDTELLIYATTLINVCLNNIPDRDTYYDQVDTLQDQGIDDIIQLYMSKQGTDLDLLRQLQIFEAVLLYEDGDETGTALKQLDDSVIMSLGRRSLNLNTTERRKSKKQQAKEKANLRYTGGLKQRLRNGTLGHTVNAVDTLAAMKQKQNETSSDVKEDRGIIINREHSIKDIAQMLTNPVSPNAEEKPLKVADMAGIVLKAKEELAKSQSKEIIKSPSIEKSTKVPELKISENDLHWEKLKQSGLNREFHICDLDFSDLKQDSDDEMTSPTKNGNSGPPPPPPNMFPSLGMPPPMPGSQPHTPKNSVPNPPPSLPLDLGQDCDRGTIKKNKKTVKLFWREIQENPIPPPIRSKVGGFIWDELPEVPVDTAMLEHLFESRTNDLIIKEKLMEPKRNLILDAKRSNAINIAMKKLPTPQTIKAAIMKMDATVIGREGIEKLLTMLPTEEEKVKIQEAQYANPDLPLGSAEQFLLALATINELSSRLKLWVFKLDFDNLEKEISEPLMDLKQGIELLKVNKTFKVILSTLRSVGSFLNGCQVKGFRLEYLSKVMEVKDTVHKHPLLYHICEMIIEKFPDTTDFFSEVGPVIRASKVDFDILSANLHKLECDCKASWDHMKRVAKHDSAQICKTKINEFLIDAAERIIILGVIKKRIMKRYSKFLYFLGVPPAEVVKTKPSEFLKVIAEFALEYRTTRERVLQQLEKRANHRERNKTRGKMITDVGNFSNKNGDYAADCALKELLRADGDTVTDGRRKYQTTDTNFIK
ncbi:uncharacterized protein LOC106717236 isoform X2 [Papilio machaon]|uniref:uncharacterized protein LOC106717236 isoform X2 n=1 Tax=Papilio machaon TaxID=76193 RepID=UPI001E664D16|nr:uncharacterized protein LOC106717236 isoform X2 [Papilio machaon]